MLKTTLLIYVTSYIYAIQLYVHWIGKNIESHLWCILIVQTTESLFSSLVKHAHIVKLVLYGYNVITSCFSLIHLNFPFYALMCFCFSNISQLAPNHVIHVSTTNIFTLQKKSANSSSFGFRIIFYFCAWFNVILSTLY